MDVLLLNPLIALIIISLLFVPAHRTNLIKDLSLFGSFIIFVLSLSLMLRGSFKDTIIQTGSYALITLPGLQLNYHFLLDELSVIFIILSTLLTIIVVLTARNIKYRIKEKYI